MQAMLMIAIAAGAVDPAVILGGVRLLDEFGFGAEEGGSWLWLLGPAGGIGFYMLIFLRYRNTDKRHDFERQTASEMLDLRTYDQQSGRVTGVENSKIRGRNSHTPLQRLGAGTTVTVLTPDPPSIPEPTTPGEAPTVPPTQPPTQPPAPPQTPPHAPGARS